MVLPGSGTLSVSQIRGEFGGSAPDSLSEYYRGGGLVPDTPANAGIPTSGAISISDFYGGDATVGHTLTIGGALLFYTTGPIPPFYASITGYGYDAPADGFGYAPGYGSISPTTYTDGGATSRTIIMLSMQIGGGLYAGNNSVTFALSGGSISNSDTTFISITNSDTAVTLTRASASYTDGGSYTSWTWSNGTFMDTVGTDSIQINV